MRPYQPFIAVGISLFCLSSLCSHLFAQQFRAAPSLDQQIKAVSPDLIIQETKLRGDASRGAILFRFSAAACIQCHTTDKSQLSIGPRLSEIASLHDESPVDAHYLLRALIQPSADVHSNYQVYNVLTEDGTTHTGLVRNVSNEQIELVPLNPLEPTITLDNKQIDTKVPSSISAMPDGLLGSLKEIQEFYDLFAYVLQVAASPESEQKLAPSPEQIAALEDWRDLAHASIIQRLNHRDLDAGRSIYKGFCADCHGQDSSQASLPIARTFASDKLKFGADPYRMFMTISKGNGLMGPVSHLTPHQRYQVVHYIREVIMKTKNPEYHPVTPDYLASLPKGTRKGDEIQFAERDYGPAFGSQLNREIASALTIKAGTWNASYDLHTMNMVAAWTKGFLDLKETQHHKGKGEGVPTPATSADPNLQGWRWLHPTTSETPSRNSPRSPLPKEILNYHGYYRPKEAIILHYSVSNREIHEALSTNPTDALHKQIKVGPGPSLNLVLANWNHLDRSKVAINKSVGSGNHGNETTFHILSNDLSQNKNSSVNNIYLKTSLAESTLKITEPGDIVLSIPQSDSEQIIDIRFGHNVYVLDSIASKATAGTSLGTTSPANFNRLFEESLLWPQILETQGTPGLNTQGYALDTITVPESTPWNSWMRTAALDFFSDGRLAVSTYGGEVWIVEGIDSELKNLRWKRFASGLYEPLGLKIIDDVIFVTCKDRIYKLIDSNNDGETDYYQNFFNDPDVSINFHAFNFDLQTDTDGNLYYAKCGHGSDYDLPGSVLKISPKGDSFEVYSTGFRVPNGLGVLPGNKLLGSDNQGQWIPASKVNLLRKDGFYGWSPTYEEAGKWSPAGGTIDITKVVAPNDFDRPLVWIPYELDNSSGGQLWVDDKRWGPLSNNILHTSFGRGWMYYILTQDIATGDKKTTTNTNPNITIQSDQQHDSTLPAMQGAIVRLPFEFQTGIMRARVNPIDGQVYATGTQGWNGGGRPGLKDHGVQRLRYTQKPWDMITKATATQGRLELQTNFPIDPNSITHENAITIQCWNYAWSKNYGSDRYSPTTGKPGMDQLPLSEATLSNNNQILTLKIPDLAPVDQLQLQLKLQKADGSLWQEELYWTIHHLPE